MTKVDKNQIAMLEKLFQLKNAIDHPLLKNESQNFKVQIVPDSSVSPAKFKPCPSVAGKYYAHPDTIAAVRKDLFVAGEGFEDTENVISCESCKKSIDLQFWQHCPYCGKVPN